MSCGTGTGAGSATGTGSESGSKLRVGGVEERGLLGSLRRLLIEYLLRPAAQKT